ncbi:MAG TPA: radical SAM protein [Clostridia bacterium]|nr:radical SAM protein [Clostridia bacterium]
MKLLLLRPYYGINICGDMNGDLGSVDYLPGVFPDLSFAYAATIAGKSDNVDLQVIDANSEKLLPYQVKKKLRDYYDMIILKAESPTVSGDVEFIKYLKQQYPHAKVVISGHIAKLLKKWLQDNLPEVDEIADIPIENYVYKLFNEKDEDINIDSFPVLDYTLLPYKNYVDDEGILRGCIHMSRGCVIGCYYCPYASFYGNKIEYRSIENVMKDIKHLLDLGVRSIQFRDQFFTCNKAMVKDLCNKIIEEGLKFNWTCETKLESLGTDLIDLMVEAGMRMICFGVESASKQTLVDFNRPAYDLEKLKSLIGYLNGKGVKTLAFYIIGFPADSPDTIKETYDLAAFLGSSTVKFSIYTPYVLEQDCNGNKIELTPDSFVPFENTMSVNSSIIPKKELNYLADQMTNMHYINTRGFRGLYYFLYRSQTDYANVVKLLKRKLSEKTILDIDEKEIEAVKMKIQMPSHILAV